MSDDELRHLSPAQVTALVRQLESRLAAAEARNAELEAELARRGGPPKTPQNSSTPPSKGFKRERRPAADGAKRGPPFGQLGTSRRRTEPAWVVLCQPRHCASCGQELAGAPQERVGTSQVVERPPVQPVVLEAWRYAAPCSHCGATTTAAYPVGFEPTRVFGPHLEALWTYLHEQHHVSYARLGRLGRDRWQLGISQGALANARRRVATRLRPEAAIREQVRASPVIGSDETSARVGGRTHWQWVFPTPTASYPMIVPRRNGAVVQDFLGDAAPETWVSDLWKPQLNAPAERHQICLAHQLRDLQYVVDREQSAWAQECQALLRLASHRAHQRDAGALWGAAYTAAVRKSEAACDALLADPAAGAEASRLWVRFREHRTSLFVFLYDAAVPPTNNTSEQALRHSVVHRKVTGGFRSDGGADAHAIVTTVLDTARKRGEHLFTTLHAALGAPTAIPPGLPVLSPSR